ncbi:MAG: hypothetical protein MMC23_000191 [Stictis urceolatum]|nr:hypothetical protein [Stictis urceolata]
MTGSVEKRVDTYGEPDDSDPGTVLQLLWEANSSLNNLTAVVQSISETMTKYIRTAFPAQPVDERYAPTVGISVTLVKVRWGWLAYPLALLSIGLAFLGLTIYNTRRHQVRPWRGHRVPLLLAHLDENVRLRAKGGMRHRTGLDDRVGETRVRLDFDGDDNIVFRRVYEQTAVDAAIASRS